MRYPVGPETQKKAAKTEPGQLAALLNRVLYSADVAEVQISEHHKTMRWVAEREFYKGDDPVPKSVPVPDRGSCYCETESLMRAIRDYLEFRSFEEVIP